MTALAGVLFCAGPGMFGAAIGETTATDTFEHSPIASGTGFSISVDGQRVAGDQTSVGIERQTTVGLEGVDIEVKYDGLGAVQPMLNVSTTDVRRSYPGGAMVEFLAISNYPSWIAHREVIVMSSDPDQFVRPIALPVGADGLARWTMPTHGPGAFTYVLRVYDSEGRFDETIPRALARTDSHYLDDEDLGRDETFAPADDEDRTAFRNIPVFGGAVTVLGKNVPAGFEVTALGEIVPVDAQRSFVIQRILSPGDHIVDVGLVGADGGDGLKFRREVKIPTDEWFYVGLADFTLGYRLQNEIEAVEPGQYEKTYTRGRLAFYLKGRIKGEYLLTASADTGEDDIENLLRNLDAKDPRNFLTRIDPDEYYPVYGDDSTAIEDAPTSGKFYVRLERGDSHVMWGNFRTQVSGSEFLRNERALYGADAVIRSDSSTSFGERTFEAEVYAASPDTLPQRDILRATGGSVYFLKYQDITIGSVTITVQHRDRLTGRVLTTRRLVAGTDYRVDYLQGVVILTRPLTPLTDATSATGAFGGEGVYLVVQYERTPTAGQLDGHAYGGRAQWWVNDSVQLGVAALSEKAGAVSLDGETVSVDHQMVGADIVVRHSDDTYIRAEVARSMGVGFGHTFSTDGGLTITGLDPASQASAANAYRVRGNLALEDATDGELSGDIGAFFEREEAGFSSLDDYVATAQTIWGGYAGVLFAPNFRVAADYESFADDKGQSRQVANLDLIYQFDEAWEATVGARHIGVVDVPGEGLDNNPQVWTGSRTEAGARLTYRPDDYTSLYAFGRATVRYDGNVSHDDRVGVGAGTLLTDDLAIDAEVSFGTSGWGGLVSLAFDPTAEQSYYIGYRLDPSGAFGVGDLVASNNGTLVAGARHRYDDVASAFAETAMDIWGDRQSLTETYGITFTPDAFWTLTASLDGGRVTDPIASDFDRYAAGLGIGYHDSDKVSGNLRFGARLEESEDGTRDQASYYLASGLSVKTDPNWRLLGVLDAVFSHSDQSSVRDGAFVEASLGAAYRPIYNDRLNALFKYAFLYDLPGADQVSAVSGREFGPQQRSHILSVDANYDLNRFVTIGAKYGLRIGDTRDRQAGDWTSSVAQLGIVRADLHIVREWDVLLEGRVLNSPTAQDTKWGGVAAVYKHFGDNLEVGVGYNFGVFSDDLRDLTYNDQGVFLNVIGQF